MTRPKIDWTKQPFGQMRSCDIGRMLGTPEGSVSKGLLTFKRWYARNPAHCPDCAAEVDIETYLECANRKNQCRSCWCCWNASYETPGIGVQRNMSVAGWASDGRY